MALGLLLAARRSSLSRLISVNDFSLHGMYRKRLARTFLGASRAPDARHPNPFTGFDDEDDLPIHETAAAGRPLHVVNATLNLVAQTSLAMQERRSESFTMTALHCGSARVGYRPSDGLRRRHLPRRRHHDVGRRGQPEHGRRLEAGADVPPDALQRAPRRVAGESRTSGRRRLARPRLSYGAAPLLTR